jgi:hypothetical protein
MEQSVEKKFTFFIVQTNRFDNLVECVVKGCYGISETMFNGNLWTQFRGISEGDRVFIRVNDDMVCGPLIVSPLPSNVRFLSTAGSWGKINHITTPKEFVPRWIEYFPWCFFFDPTLTTQVNYCKLSALLQNGFRLDRLGILSHNIGSELWKFIEANGFSFADYVQRVEPNIRIQQPTQSVQRAFSGYIHIRTKRGVLVRSKSEALIDNWLHEHNIAAEYESCIALGGYVIAPDFYLPKYVIYIEHLGLYDSNQDYRRNWEWKKRLYDEHGIKYIEVRESDIADLDRFLTTKLKDYLK